MPQTAEKYVSRLDAKEGQTRSHLSASWGGEDCMLTHRLCAGNRQRRAEKAQKFILEG